jgi:hypothetical protein
VSWTRRSRVRLPSRTLRVHPAHRTMHVRRCRNLHRRSVRGCPLLPLQALSAAVRNDALDDCTLPGRCVLGDGRGGQGARLGPRRRLAEGVLRRLRQPHAHHQPRRPEPRCDPFGVPRPKIPASARRCTSSSRTRRRSSHCRTTGCRGSRSVSGRPSRSSSRAKPPHRHRTLHRGAGRFRPRSCPV